MRQKRVLTIVFCMCLCVSITGCSMETVKDKANSAVDTVKETASNAAEAVGDAAVTAKDAVVSWYSNLDFGRFKDGWDASVEFLGSQYAAAISGEYIANIETAIGTLKSDINSAVGYARGSAQEAGFLAEKWVSDTFNINAAANGSDYQAEVVGSNGFGSVDVTTNYGENASLKYYQDATGSAQAQAKTLFDAYQEYLKKTPQENPPTLAEYMNERGYDPNTQDALLTSVYEGQTRIIPSDQLTEATQYLQGKIDKIPAGDPVYQDTLTHLRDRLQAPDGTESIPLSREEAQAIAELAQNGEFNPEDFNIKISTVISPKYVMKQAIGTGIEVAAINTVLTIGPDIYSILKDIAKGEELDEDALKETGVEGAIAASQGFAEGSISQIVTTLCQAGVLGEGLMEANPSVVAALTVLVIEAAIHGYELSQGKITAEDYGNMMVDRLMVSALALPTSALLLAFLPASKIIMMAGCMGGGMIACLGYMAAKQAVMDLVDGGGFEAIIPVEATNAISVAKQTIASMNIGEKWSSFKDSVVSTASNGYIQISTMINGG